MAKLDTLPLGVPLVTVKDTSTDEEPEYIVTVPCCIVVVGN